MAAAAVESGGHSCCFYCQSGGIWSCAAQVTLRCSVFSSTPAWALLPGWLLIICAKCYPLSLSVLITKGAGERGSLSLTLLLSLESCGPSRPSGLRTNYGDCLPRKLFSVGWPLTSDSSYPTFCYTSLWELSARPFFLHFSSLAPCGMHNDNM